MIDDQELIDMIRESVRTVLQELVEFEAAGVIGAERVPPREDVEPVVLAAADQRQLLRARVGDVARDVAAVLPEPRQADRGAGGEHTLGDHAAHAGDDFGQLVSAA